MLREECNIQIGLRISKHRREQLKIYMNKKGINTEASAARQLFIEKLNEELGRTD